MKRRKTTKKTWAAAGLAVMISVLSLPCQKKSGIKGLDLTVAFSRRSLTDDLFVDVTSKWRLSKDFQGFRENRPLLVRLEHDGEVLVEDTFVPEVPASHWVSGEVYEFVRRIYIPRFIDEYDPGFRGAEPVGLTVGFSGDPRTGEGTETVILRKRVRISPASMTPAILYVDGWLENARSGAVGRWTGRTARCLVDNPKRNALLVIRGETDLVSMPGQEITVRLGGTVLERFRPAAREFERSYPVSKESLGNDKDLFLEISVDKTFLPAGAGSAAAEHGVFISFVYFR